MQKTVSQLERQVSVCDTQCFMKFHLIQLPIEPSGFDEVSVEEIGPRFIILSWDEPAFPNGILINYTVLQNEEEIADVSPSFTTYNVTGLLPFTNYQFSVLACTAAGCVENPPVDFMTLEDGKKDWYMMGIKRHNSTQFSLHSS